MFFLRQLSALLLVSCAPAFGLQDSAAKPSAELAPISERMYVVAERFSDVDGIIHQLGLRGEAANVVLVFLDPRSGAANARLARLEELSLEAMLLGIEFYAVVSSASVSSSEARDWRDENEIGFPLLFDASGELASRMQPTHMPECFLLSRADGLAYRGRIDDGKQAGQGSLSEAMLTLAHGGQPAPSYQESLGEPFEAWPATLDEIELTYNRHIAPIMEASCVDCHRPDDVAPFALDSYRKVKRRSQMVLFVCEDRIMPPWQANPEINLFREQRSISKRQIEVIRTWSANKAPEGSPEDLLPRPDRSHDGWRMGEPDLILSLPAFDLPAEGADVFQNFVIPSEFLEAKSIVGIEFRPRATSVMHHMALHVDVGDSAQAMDDADPGAGFSSFGPGVAAGQKGSSIQGLDYPLIRGWAPGQEPFRAPIGLGIPIPVGADFVVATHYHLDGQAVQDRSQIGLYFGEPDKTQPMFLATMLTSDIQIPAGETNYVRHVLSTLPVDAIFHNVTPHMHALGTTVNLFATRPGEERMHLLEIPRWDYRWQNTYTFLKPIPLPKGTLMEAVHTFDNSSGNPDNPSIPPIHVGEGWYTFDEMCILYFNLVLKNPAPNRTGFFVNMQTTLKSD